MKKNIIFYSNYCTYSKEIINQISKTPINNKILYVCVDDKNIQLPAFIKAVPTVYLVEDKKIVIDEQIPKWIEEQISKKKVVNNIHAYFGSSDNSYGASFSSLNDKDSEKPFISSFTYIGDEQKIETPNDDSSDNQNVSSKGLINSSIDNDLEKLQNNRQQEFASLNRT